MADPALVALSPTQVPRLAGAHFGGASLAFTFAVASLTAVGFGLGPALGFRKLAAASARRRALVRSAARGGGSPGAGWRWRWALLARTSSRPGRAHGAVRAPPPGRPRISPRGTVSLAGDVAGVEGREREQRRASRRTCAHGSCLPGVRDAGERPDSLPLSGGRWWWTSWSGEPTGPGRWTCRASIPDGLWVLPGAGIPRRAPPARRRPTGPECPPGRRGSLAAGGGGAFPGPEARWAGGSWWGMVDDSLRPVEDSRRPWRRTVRERGSWTRSRRHA